MKNYNTLTDQEIKLRVVANYRNNKQFKSWPKEWQAMVLINQFRMWKKTYEILGPNNERLKN